MARKTNKEQSRLNASGLTDLQDRFCVEYVRDCNGVRAYQRARDFCKVGGDKPCYKSAAARASGLLKMPVVRARIDALLHEISDKATTDVAFIVNSLRDVIEYDPGRLMSWGPWGATAKDSEELTVADRRMVESVQSTTTADGQISVKLTRAKPMDAMRCLVTLWSSLGGGGGARGDEGKALRSVLGAMKLGGPNKSHGRSNGNGKKRVSK